MDKYRREEKKKKEEEEKQQQEQFLIERAVLISESYHFRKALN